MASNLDALAGIWGWTDADVLVHALPLFHVHGLILGVVGPLRRGGSLHHRLAADCEADPALAAGVGAARLLVSGSAALPALRHDRDADELRGP